ncbi:hypothetical protein LINGRAHAP2_LOCUS25462 [Linum grandiflorum]
MKQQRSPAAVWDCESSLYDSFELRSFEKQLSSALTSRTLSMPHLSSDRVRVAPAPPPSSTNDPPVLPKKINTTMSSKISKSVQRFLKSVFIARSNDHNHRHNKQSPSKDRNNGGAYLRVKERVVAGAGDQGIRYVVYDKSGALTTIPEGPESDFGLSPDIKSLVRKTASERFTAARAPMAGYGISCA